MQLTSETQLYLTDQPTEIETQRATFAGKTNMYHSNSVFFFIERQTERPTDWKADTEMYSSDYQPLKDSIIFLSECQILDLLL